MDTMSSIESYKINGSVDLPFALVQRTDHELRPARSREDREQLRAVRRTGPRNQPVFVAGKYTCFITLAVRRKREAKLADVGENLPGVRLSVSVCPAATTEHCNGVSGGSPSVKADTAIHE